MESPFSCKFDTTHVFTQTKTSPCLPRSLKPRNTVHGDSFAPITRTTFKGLTWDGHDTILYSKGLPYDRI